MKKFLLICALALAFTGCNKEAAPKEGVKISEAKTDVDVVYKCQYINVHFWLDKNV